MQIIVKQMKVLLVKFNFTNKVITYVKDKRINLNSLIIVVTFVVLYKSI
jgi:hypothetical protein